MFHFLRTQGRRPFDRAEIAAATGYRPTSLPTYFSKALVGTCITNVGRGTYQASGMNRMSRAEFRRILAQNKIPKGFFDWKQRIEDLAEFGAKKYKTNRAGVSWVLNGIAEKHQLIRLKTKT